MKAANLGIRNRQFRKRLGKARRRFNSQTEIDIRGCQVGASEEYLQAVSVFFGSGRTHPHVSAPQWFEAFPAPDWELVQDRARYQALIEDPDVVAALREWAPIAGVQISPDPTTQDLSLYLDGAGLVLPVVSSGPAICGRQRIRLLLGIEDAGKKKWLNAQWDPVLGSAARRLLAGWTRGKPAPPIALLCVSLSVGQGEAQLTAVSPDPFYQRLITHV